MKVIIVDDEVLVRLGIKTYLEGYEDITVKGTFALAGEALAYMEREDVDIVLTDIEMGQMSGLEYIKALKACNYHCGIVILSCHENFSYVREAMNLGADKYMLKQEVCEDVLVNELRKINQRKQAKYRQESHNLAETPGREDIWTGGTLAGEGVSYRIAALKLWEKYDERGQSKPLDVDEDMLFQVLEDAVAQTKGVTILKDRQGRMFLIFQFSKELGEEACQEQISGVCYRLEQNTKLYVNRSLAVGLSPLFDDHREMKEQYETALRCLEYRFYDKKEIFRDIPRQDGYRDLRIETEFPLEEAGMEDIREQLEEYLNLCSDQKVDPERVRETLLKSMHVFLGEVLRSYHLESGKESLMRYDLSYQEIHGVSSRTALVKIILEHVRGFAEAVRAELEQTDDFSRIPRYIDSHYREQLTLTEISERYYMSVNYFCQRFKRHTGTTFINYINEKRIGEVKKYLHSGEYSLEQISELTGFHNVNYMVRLFKKLTGTTVREYRSGIKS